MTHPAGPAQAACGTPEAPAPRRRRKAGSASRPTLAEIRAWPATVSVTEAALAMGVSKSQLYDLIRCGESPVRTLPLGKCQRVVTADLIRLLDAA